MRWISQIINSISQVTDTGDSRQVGEPPPPNQSGSKLSSPWFGSDRFDIIGDASPVYCPLRP
jgi:hypothetical protein